MKGSAPILIFLIAGAVTLACTERDKYGKPVDTPTSGNIKIAADESLRPLVEAEVAAFESIYQDARVEVEYLSEPGAIELLLEDSVRLAVVTRTLTAREKDYLWHDRIEPVEILVATGAVALIIHRDNADSLLKISQLKNIMEGKISNWNQLHSGGISAPVEVIFDNPASGIIRLLQDSVTRTHQLPAGFYAVNNNQAVVDYVAKKPNAIGLIGVEWISDSDDSVTHDFLKTIRVMSLTRDSTFCKPYQAYIAMNQYPLCRKIMIISREARAGLGSGFTAFFASDKGQRIVLKAGLVPATMPVRIVEINEE